MPARRLWRPPRRSSYALCISRPRTPNRPLRSGRRWTTPCSRGSWRCGFSSPSHFSRRFQAAYGVAPSEWRRLRGAVVTVDGPE
ncbi:AraC family transcriptional regulator [Streptomyces macrolidinus]|uniref:AraC family transcriptional regulator n=1 Tax=Streptomyces macrolidinus TaxID=2952607 RepID=UPI0027E30AC4|nr:AraC family transcriptional regulator [Streptomyces macrolidinus]